MATVCSNTSSSSSSSISNSSVQKLAEVNESEREQEEHLTTTNQEQFLFYETHLKETTNPTNTAHSSNLNEFLYFHDDHSANTAPTPPIVSLSEGNNKKIFQNQATSTSTSTTNDYQALRIKVKSIENHLLPLVNQITTLVNFRDLAYRKQHGSSSSPRLSSSLNLERNATALVRVGEAVGIAVERFVNVGEKIAYENPSIKLEMLDACRHAKNAGNTEFLFRKIEF